MLLEKALPSSATTAGCPELDAVIATGDLVDAAVHARGCARCGTVARVGA
jgi:hypothetical protein